MSLKLSKIKYHLRYTLACFLSGLAVSIIFMCGLYLVLHLKGADLTQIKSLNQMINVILPVTAVFSICAPVGPLVGKKIIPKKSHHQGLMYILGFTLIMLVFAILPNFYAKLSTGNIANGLSIESMTIATILMLTGFVSGGIVYDKFMPEKSNIEIAVFEQSSSCAPQPH